MNRTEALSCLKTVYRAAYQAEACKRCADIALMGWNGIDASEKEAENQKTDAFLDGILSSIEASDEASLLPFARIVEAIVRDDVANIPVCLEARACDAVNVAEEKLGVFVPPEGQKGF